MFEEQLARNMARRISDAGYRWVIDTKRNYHLIQIPEDADYEDIRKVLQAVSEVHGVKWVSPSVWFPASEFRREDHTPDYELIKKTTLKLADAYYKPDAKFAIKANRSEKQYTIPSDEIERWLGTEVINHTKWDKVNLRNPDRAFRIRIYTRDLFIIPERYDGPGGLPVNSAGHVLSLLSGGFDSPIASWLMARRGCSVDFIHFTASHPHPELFENSKMDRLAQWLSRFTLQSRLFLVPYTYFDMTMPDHSRPKALMVFRRFMSRTAEHLAEEIGAKALVTGDSLSQVASQTLDNLVANYDAISMPVLQPLIGYNKDDIVELSRQIGSYDLSVEPYKDCCSLIARNPEIKAKAHLLQEYEEEWIPDYDKLIEQSLGDALCVEYRCGKKLNTYTNTLVVEE